MNTMKIKALLAALICTSGLMAQKIVGPPVVQLERFKPNVTSLVIKANPITAPFGYLDAGVEVRNQKTGWVLMNHTYLGGESTLRTSVTPARYSVTSSFVRFEGAHRWYRSRQSYWRGNRERYTGVYVTGGFTNFSFTEDFYFDDLAAEYIFISPLQSASRIDFIIGADFGRTRNFGGPEALVYWESSWKLGYNLGSGLPQVLYGIRFNYKAN